MTKTFDLEERTFQYGKACGLLIKSLSRNFITNEIGRQLLRAACSVGANYIEANEALGEKDFKMHLKICGKKLRNLAFG